MIRNRIKEYRARHNMKQEELARLADRLISSGLAGTLQHFD